MHYNQYITKFIALNMKESNVIKPNESSLSNNKNIDDRNTKSKGSLYGFSQGNSLKVATG